MRTIPLQYYKIAESLSHYSRIIYDHGFAFANGGNLSARLHGGMVISTPTMESKGFLTPADMVITDFDGNKLYGKKEVSSEIQSHLAVYRANRGAHAVIHSHPPYACSYCFGESSLSEPLSPESILWLGDICTIPFILPGSPELASEIERLCKGKYVIMLENHGLITWGATIRDALWRTEVMENHCKIWHIISSRGDRAKELSDKEKIMLEKLKDKYFDPELR